MDAIPRTRALMTAAAYAALVAVALAQPPGRGPGRGPGGGMGGLLQSDEVRRELDVTESQMEELEAFQEEMRDKMREQFRQMRNRDGDFDRGAMREQFETMRKEAEERLSGVLSSSQLDRLKQINLQQQLEQSTSRALMGGPLAEELNLTQEQQDQLREKLREVQSKLDEKIRAAREEAREQLLTVLSSEQRAKLDSMTGEPFTMTRPDGPPGFNRRGGPPGAGPRERGPRGFGRGDRPGPPPGGRRGGPPSPPPPPPGGEPEL